jgi:hypothetical protein
VNSEMSMVAVRCPYCVKDRQFRQMAALPDGRFVCDKCGHLETPGNEQFDCPCQKCFEARGFDRRAG